MKQEKKINKLQQKQDVMMLMLMLMTTVWLRVIERRRHHILKRLQVTNEQTRAKLETLK